MAYARGIDPRRPRARAPRTAGSLCFVSVLGLACAGASGEPMNSTSGDPPEVPAWVCVPGETQPCPCDDGLEGSMTCDPQGASFGECDCSPGAVSQGPAPTSTGTGSGSGSDTGSGTAGSGPGDTTMDPPGESSGDPSTSSSGAPDPTTSGGSTGGSSSSG